MAASKVSRLDRRVKGDAITNGFAGSTLTFTLPYKIATDGSEGTLVVVRISTGSIVTSTRPAINQVAVAGVPNTPADFYIGVLYTMRYRFSTIMKRSVDRNGRTIVDARGRLILRYVKVRLHDAVSLMASVTLDGRTLRNYTFTNPTPDKPTEFRFPVQGRNTTAVIEITDTSPGTVSIDAAEWDGTHVVTTTRV
jgi:hypothetical protein